MTSTGTEVLSKVVECRMTIVSAAHVRALARLAAAE